MLFDSIILEVALGVVFIYLLLSLACTAASEFIARILALRSNYLEKGIRNLLNDPNGGGLAKEFYEHPLITGFTQTGKFDKWLNKDSKPSYIPARTFAIVLLDIIAQDSSKQDSSTKPKSLDEIRNTVENCTRLHPDTKRALLVLMNNSNNELKAKKNIEDWFNDGMDRVSGWYTRHIQLIILVLAILISALINVDTFMIANNLAQDSTLRASIIASANEFATNSIPSASNVSLDANNLKVATQLQMLPLGWSQWPEGLGAWLMKISGLLVTIFAISLGAPFWFDMLKKVVNLRGTGKPPK